MPHRDEPCLRLCPLVVMQLSHRKVLVARLLLPSFADGPKPLLLPSPDDRPSGCRFHPRCTHVFGPCAKQAPALQAVNKTTQSHTRSVRCHLYPEHPSPPALVNTKKGWHDKDDAGPVLFSVRDLGVHFPMKRGFLGRPAQVHKAVDGLSFDLKQGQTLALVGESGSGKSTACRVLLGLQKITCGEVIFRDEAVCDLRGRALKQFRKQVQIIFQDPFSSMNPRMLIQDILMEGVIAQGQGPSLKEQEILVKELLNMVGLPRTAGIKYPHEFSGGQRQRIAIARTLLGKPKLLVMDEATSALDYDTERRVCNNLLETMNNSTVLFITHRLSSIRRADRILMMHDGALVESGTHQELMDLKGRYFALYRQQEAS